MNEEAKATPMYEFYVAGIQHHKLHTCIKEVKVGDCLSMVVETDPTILKYDPNAIRLEFASINQDKDIMIGFIPQKKGDYSAKVAAAMIHKNLRCEVLELNPEAKTWEQLKVGIFDEEGFGIDEETILEDDSGCEGEIL